MEFERLTIPDVVLMRPKVVSGAVFDVAVDLRRVERELGFSASKRIDDGLRETFDWFVANEAWWRAIMDGSCVGWIERQYSNSR